MYALTMADSIVARLFAFSLWLYSLIVAHLYTALLRICNFVLVSVLAVSLWVYRFVVVRLLAIFLLTCRLLGLRSFFRWVYSKLTFAHVHYLYITSCTMLAFGFLVYFRELTTLDAFFMAVSACTETGLNVVDLKDLNTGGQIVLFIFPIIANVSFINIDVLWARISCYKRRIDKIGWILLGKAQTSEGSVPEDIKLQAPSSQQSTDPTPSLSAAILEDAIAHQAFLMPESDEHGHIVWAENVDSRGPTLVDGGESSPGDTSGSPLDRTTSQDSSRTKRSFGRMARSAAHHGVSSAHLLESAFVLGSGSLRRSARHAGTAAFTLAKVNPAVLINQVVMFFLAVLPIVVIIRMTDESRRRAMNLVSSPSSWRGYLGGASHYIEQQMTFDLSLIIICIFIICWIESDHLKGKTTFNVFAVLFECVSAYTNAGLSLGASGANTSLSHDFHPASKIVLCVAMWRGRHRVLTDNGDPTVRLPSDRVTEREDEAQS